MTQRFRVCKIRLLQRACFACNCSMHSGRVLACFGHQQLDMATRMPTRIERSILCVILNHPLGGSTRSLAFKLQRLRCEPRQQWIASRPRVRPALKNAPLLSFDSFSFVFVFFQHLFCVFILLCFVAFLSS